MKSLLKSICLTVTLVLPTLSFGQDKSQKTLYPDGFNAAAYTDLSLDRGTINDSSISSFRLLAGLQLYRLWDVVSLSVGYGKVGWYDAIYDWDENMDTFQVNYQGPTVGIEFMPNWPVSFEIIHFYNPSGGASEKVKNSLLTGDVRVRYDYDVKDTTLYLGVHIWKQLKLVLGTGTRKFDWTYKTTQGDNDVAVNRTGFTDRAQTGSQSEGYFLIGLRATQVMSW